MNTDLLHQLKRVEQLATASKLLRLLQAPGRYLYAIGFRLLRYRATKKGVMKQTNTFFGYWPLFGNEVYTHGLSAILGGYFGYAFKSKLNVDDKSFIKSAHV